MLTLDHYLDLAKARNDLKSDRALGRSLGIDSTTVNFYRNKGTLPSPDTMVRIADLCGIKADQALIDLAIWHAKSDRVLEVYRSIYSRITGTAAAVLLLVFVQFSSTPAQARGTIEELSTRAGAATVYYGKLALALLREIARAMAAPLHSTICRAR